VFAHGPPQPDSGRAIEPERTLPLSREPPGPSRAYGAAGSSARWPKRTGGRTQPTRSLTGPGRRPRVKT
jgi:hypothetical protein